MGDTPVPSPSCDSPAAPPKRPLPKWNVQPAGAEAFTVEAWTKGEARALAKDRLGVKSLPRSVVVTAVPASE